MIEGRTYRYYDHSLGLNRIVPTYRSEEELEYWKQRDPIDIHKKLLLSQDIATQAEIDQIEEETMKQIDEAVEFARESPYPDPSELFDDMFANPIPLD